MLIIAINVMTVINALVVKVAISVITVIIVLLAKNVKIVNHVIFVISQLIWKIAYMFLRTHHCQETNILTHFVKIQRKMSEKHYYYFFVYVYIWQ